MTLFLRRFLPKRGLAILISLSLHTQSRKKRIEVKSQTLWHKELSWTLVLGRFGSFWSWHFASLHGKPNSGKRSGNKMVPFKRSDIFSLVSYETKPAEGHASSTLYLHENKGRARCRRWLAFSFPVNSKRRIQAPQSSRWMDLVQSPKWLRRFLRPFSSSTSSSWLVPRRWRFPGRFIAGIYSPRPFGSNDRQRSSLVSLRPFSLFILPAFLTGSLRIAALSLIDDRIASSMTQISSDEMSTKDYRM